MIVPEEIRKCVGFVGSQGGDHEPKLRATCFFMVRKSELLPDLWWSYVVTARHVIDNIAISGAKVVLRMNFEDGTSKWVDCTSPWIAHTDPTVDVVVSAFPMLTPIDQRCVPLEMRVGHPSITHIYNPTIGSELFFPGLFVGHSGKQRNIPVIRVGHIAAMPEEKVSAKFAPGVYHDIDAYLIEARSIGGFSGSPVFFMTEATLPGGGLTTGGGRFFLMGLMQGHFDANQVASDDSSALEPATINTGIGIVVPVEKIIEVIQQYQDAERAGELAEAQRRGVSVPTT